MIHLQENAPNCAILKVKTLKGQSPERVAARVEVGFASGRYFSAVPLRVILVGLAIFFIGDLLV